MFGRMKGFRPNESEEEVSDLPRKQGHSTVMIFVPMLLVFKNRPRDEDYYKKMLNACYSSN